MALLSSKEFYSRHKNEIEKYIFKNKKTLIVSQKNSNLIFNENINDDILDFNFDLDFESQFTLNNNKYDLIVLSDVLELSQDVINLLNILKDKLEIDGKILITSLNPIWNGLLTLLEKINFKNRSTKRSYIHLKKISTVLSAIDLEVINKKSRQYFPFKLFLFGSFLNNLIEILFYFLNYGIRTYICVQRSNLRNHVLEKSKTVIVPAKNEEGNLSELINRIPYLGKNTEVIISCGDSRDKTLAVAKSLNSENFEIKVIEQTGKGKANAVWEAIEQSKNEVIGILDADLSVDPETLNSFFGIIDTGKADFVNGTRLIYSMEKGSMRYINNIGNRLFQFIIAGIIRLPLTDSLCGTKIFKRDLYEKIKLWQKNVRVNDPFGDFDLLFSAAYTGQKIIEIPIHYRARTYGKTQIKRFKDGSKLIRYLIMSFYKFNSSS